MTKEDTEDKMFLTEEEISQLGEIDRLMVMTKARLGDIELQKAHLNAESQGLVEQFHKQRTEFMDKMNEMAVAHGIDPEGQEKFSFDTNEMCFRKVTP